MCFALMGRMLNGEKMFLLPLLAVVVLKALTVSGDDDVSLQTQQQLSSSPSTYHLMAQEEEQDGSFKAPPRKLSPHEEAGEPYKLDLPKRPVAQELIEAEPLSDPAWTVMSVERQKQYAHLCLRSKSMYIRKYAFTRTVHNGLEQVVCLNVSPDIEIVPGEFYLILMQHKAIVSSNAIRHLITYDGRVPCFFLASEEWYKGFKEADGWYHISPVKDGKRLTHSSFFIKSDPKSKLPEEFVEPTILIPPREDASSILMTAVPKTAVLSAEWNLQRGSKNTPIKMDMGFAAANNNGIRAPHRFPSVGFKNVDFVKVFAPIEGKRCLSYILRGEQYNTDRIAFWEVDLKEGPFVAARQKADCTPGGGVFFHTTSPFPTMHVAKGFLQRCENMQYIMEDQDKEKKPYPEKSSELEAYHYTWPRFYMGDV
eukprot:GHVS01023679.1.p1 GENE.GHVS01023679.1~~GHVS01023679.1.p1  ORF type:complete len:425 (-),score=48.70 GHVS01023679.1:44-1318(-)